MKAIGQHGDDLEIRELDAPEPGCGEVRIRVAAAGVNRPDILQRKGQYPPPSGASKILGLEVAGWVEQTGPAVWDLREGDPVCALVAGGGYAELCVAPAVQCLPVPAGLDVADAAALPEAVFTVWANLFEAAGLLPGERVLIHGGSSGIGTTAIQMARARGAEVYTTAGSAERARRCEDLGAARAADHRDEDFVQVFRNATEEKHPMDVVLDLVGGEYVAKNLSLLRQAGRHVSIGVMGGPEATIPIFHVMQRRLVLTGSTLRGRPVPEKGRLRDEVRNHVWPWVESSLIRPQISHRLPLEDARDAHALLERSEHFGKVLLQV
ncbi:MAG TPA: NAD(P)H-quinone oxidoreductase [Myxococcales bacterium LLY-WYZ-16_1]|nr:NAD(P)H-quinone oxidoreductase [Myxococcales bacterium LLY-WYZ-16_1]